MAGMETATIDYVVHNAEGRKPVHRVRQTLPRAEIDRLDREGYLLLPGLIAGDQLRHLREAVDRVTPREDPC